MSGGRIILQKEINKTIYYLTNSLIVSSFVT